MKRVISCFLVICLMLTLCVGCSSNKRHEEKDVIKFRIATVQGEDTPFHKVLLRFKEEVEKRCGDRVEVELYPNSQLIGSERDLANCVLLGSLEGVMLVDSCINSVDNVPMAYIGSVPFLFSDTEDFYNVMDNYAIEKLNQQYADIGLTTLCYIHAGSIDIENTVRPIQAIEDMKGLKVRIFDNDGLYKMLEACKASPVNMAFGEVYTGLQQGAIDGILTNSFQFVPMNFTEVTKYHTNINAFFNFQALAFNTEWFEGLPEDIQIALKEAGQAAYEYDRDEVCPASDASDYKTIEDSGVEVTYLTDQERAEFVDACKDSWKYFEEKIGKEDFAKLLEIVGKEME